jgi:2',3'-cyclic-nucleotide 2'-phosphodiesterase (5'-nucleotidase family)
LKSSIKLRILWFVFSLLTLSASASSFYTIIDSPMTDLAVRPSAPKAYVLNSAMDSFIAPYRRKMNLKMMDTLAFNPVELTKGGSNNELGKWVTDAIYWYAKDVLKLEADFSICNPGGIRVKTLGQGFVTLKSIYELMPFDNQLVVLDLKNALIDSLHLKVSHGWPVSSAYTIPNKNGADSVSIWTINKSSKGLDYKVVISDFLANGGDKLNYLIPLIQTKTNVLMRDAIIAYAKHQKTICLRCESASPPLNQIKNNANK